MLRTARSKLLKDLKSQRLHLDKLAKQLKITQQEEWYGVTNKHIIHDPLIHNTYNSSLYSTLSTVYPEFTWHPWEFHLVPRRFWKEEKNQKLYLDWFAEEMNIDTQGDWYSIKFIDLENKGGATLLQKNYHDSLHSALESIYPQFIWNAANFSTYPRNHWSKLYNHRLFFESLADELGFTSMEHWCTVRVSDVMQQGGSGLLTTYYSSSLIKALRSVYPEYEWREWMFSGVPNRFWQKETNILQYKNWLHTILESRSSVSRIQLEQLGGSTLICRNGGMHKLLSSWAMEGHIGSSFINSIKSQNQLLSVVHQLFQRTAAHSPHSNTINT